MWAEALMLFIHRMQKYQSTFSQISAWHFRTLLGGYNGFNTETSDEKRKKVRLCQVIWVLTRYDIHSTQGEKELSWRTLSVFSSSVYRKKPRKWFCGKRECFAAGLIIYFFLVKGGSCSHRTTSPSQSKLWPTIDGPHLGHFQARKRSPRLILVIRICFHITLIIEHH